MGGDYYDRPVLQVKPDVNQSQQQNQQQQMPQQQFSAISQKIFQNYTLHKSMDPLRFKTEHLKCLNKNPIVFALDVTGSMGDWTKIIYDKMPMFYGQIMMKGYLKDPAISFCAIGDATCDQAPLQVTTFGQGKQIDELINKMYLEGRGGGNQHESYEIAAYFYLNYCNIDSANIPFFFVTGDELFYEELENETVEQLLGYPLPEHCKTFPSSEVWKHLKDKFNVFHLHKPYFIPHQDTQIKQQWTQALGQDHILPLETPKACVDVMLGAISITSGSRTLEQYIQDMQERGQDQARIDEVVNALTALNKSIVNKTFVKVENQNLEQEDDEEQKEEEKINLQDKLQLIEQARAYVMEVLKKEDSEYNKDIGQKKDLILLNQAVIPNEFICPITQEIMLDPVLAEDGHNYEKVAITQWLEKNQASPLNGLQMTTKNIIMNLALKKSINDFLEQLNKNQQDQKNQL